MLQNTNLWFHGRPSVGNIGEVFMLDIFQFSDESGANATQTISKFKHGKLGRQCNFESIRSLFGWDQTNEAGDGRIRGGWWWNRSWLEAEDLLPTTPSFFARERGIQDCEIFQKTNIYLSDWKANFRNHYANWLDLHWSEEQYLWTPFPAKSRRFQRYTITKGN